MLAKIFCHSGSKRSNWSIESEAQKISAYLLLLRQVENLVDIELAYINTKHPDFTEAGLVHKALTDGLREDLHRIKLQDQTNKQQDENRVRFVYTCQIYSK